MKMDRRMLRSSHQWYSPSVSNNEEWFTSPYTESEPSDSLTSTNISFVMYS